jgi:transcriptional regulator with XRE-family HTH domain
VTGTDDLPARLSRNVKELRTERGLTQQEMARLAGLPRATWANLESAAANPTLAVLHRAALALQVPLEDLVAAPRATTRLYRRDVLAERTRGTALVRALLPDDVPGAAIERLELPPGARLVGTAHPPGTREHLACESGEIELVTSGETLRLGSGDLAVFRGDQRHTYANPGRRTAVGYSVVLVAPV